MTKWFDTNYHYLVPEFEPGMKFKLASTKPIDQFQEALALGIHTRPVLLGPLTFLLLGKCKGAKLKPLGLLDKLLPVYEEVLWRLAHAGADWVQVDEPVLALDLPTGSARRDGVGLCAAQRGLRPDPGLSGHVFRRLVGQSPGGAQAAGGGGAPRPGPRAEQLDRALDLTPPGMMLSLGVVDGRNVWRADLDRALGLLERAAARLGPDRIMVAPSCSLLHCPIDLDNEHLLDAELKGWMAFAKQKLQEVAILARAVNQGRAAVADELAASRAAVESRNQSARTHNPAVRERMAGVGETMLRRQHPFARAPRRPAPPPAAALAPHHHHRLVSADRRGAQGPRRLEEGRVVVGSV